MITGPSEPGLGTEREPGRTDCSEGEAKQRYMDRCLCVRGVNPQGQKNPGQMGRWWKEMVGRVQSLRGKDKECAVLPGGRFSLG